MVRGYLMSMVTRNSAPTREETEAALVEAVEDAVREVEQAREEFHTARYYPGGGAPHEAERRFNAAIYGRRAAIRELAEFRASHS